MVLPRIYIHTIALVCDNCHRNQGVYSLRGSPGKIDRPNGSLLFLIFDDVHIFKNVRNNWITEALKQLSFNFDRFWRVGVTFVNFI